MLPRPANATRCSLGRDNKMYRAQNWTYYPCKMWRFNAHVSYNRKNLSLDISNVLPYDTIYCSVLNLTQYCQNLQYIQCNTTLRVFSVNTVARKFIYCSNTCHSQASYHTEVEICLSLLPTWLKRVVFIRLIRLSSSSIKSFTAMSSFDLIWSMQIVLLTCVI